MLGSGSLSGLNLRLRSRDNARLRRRRAGRRFQLAPGVLRLEERCMLDAAPNQFPAAQVAAAVSLDTIIWNGGDPLPGAQGITSGGVKVSFTSPAAQGAMKTITLTNNGTETVYPFLRDTNTAKDPAATNPPSGSNPGQYYDPQDLTVAGGSEFREYIGYQTSAGTFMGLPSGATIKFQVPLVFWAAAQMYIATSPEYLTKSDAVYDYNSSAKISIQDSSSWVVESSRFPAGEKPAIVFYYDTVPHAPSDAAPAQLIEWNFRDPYYMNFIKDPEQTKVLMNYDVSYVNKLSAPVAMEATDVPITSGDQLSTTTPPTYYGYENYGWNPTDKDKKAFDKLLAEFVDDQGKNKLLGDYFGGKGWPEYYEPDTIKDIVIPSGGNVFAQSPLVNAPSPYANHYLLTSSGKGPLVITGIGGALLDGTKIIKFAPPQPNLDLFKQLKKGMLVLNTGKSTLIPPDTTIDDVGMMDGKPYIKLSNNAGVGENQSGYSLDFKTPLSDYAVTDITKLWYSWANYYVTKVFAKYPSTVNATLAYKPPTTAAPNYNAFTLSSVPKLPLLPGMTVSGQSWINPGVTAILRITNSKGVPIGSATAAGDIIYLSRLPTSTPTAGDFSYAFGKPAAIPYSDQVNTYDLTFDTDADKAKAQLFAGSVYAVMAAEAATVPAKPKPPSLNSSQLVVNNVITFNANLPDDKLTGGVDLTGQVRDVVKSLLRGVWNFEAVPNQKKWYPDPAAHTGGKDFNVYNLDPFVWFVRSPQALGTFGYSFSIDDDVSNPSAPGPILKEGATSPTDYNHLPNNLQIEVGGIDQLTNKNAWFPTLRWGTISTDATITKYEGNNPNFANDYMITLTAANAMTLFHKIFPPGPGEVGATISAAGYLKPGTTVTFLGPNGLDKPQIILSQAPLKTTGKEPSDATPITITGPFELT